MAAHAFSLLDSYIYGFALQETSLPFETSEELVDVAQTILESLPADEYPYLTEMVEHALQPGYAFANEYESGLGLIVDGIARAHEVSASGR